MKNTIFYLLFIMASATATANCESAYSATTYALSHAKKALNADNFDHQMYYADRALEAFEKTKNLIANCGCSNSMNSILDGLENLKEAISPTDWEMGRHYSKKAYENAQDILSALDTCSGETSETIDYNIGTTITNSGSNQNLSAEAASLQEQQQQLEQQQQKLVEQQQQLEQKLEEQRQLSEKMRVNRKLELEEQLRLKYSAEESLQGIRSSLKELALSLKCENALTILQENLIRSDDALNNETLADTRKYYLQQTITLQTKVSEAFKKCNIQ